MPNGLLDYPALFMLFMFIIAIPFPFYHHQHTATFVLMKWKSFLNKTFNFIHLNA